MTQVILDDLSFGFERPLFERISATFDRGWAGLVGANGAGKTSLLRLIAGDLQPSSGAVRGVTPARVVWCHQQSHSQARELAAFAEDCSGPAQRWRGLLGLEREAFGSMALEQSGQGQHFEQLSPGERKRWQLAFALSQEPDVLLLDEPTNHLDGAARALLLPALQRFRGVGIVVSHDRTLLDALVTRTARLDAHGLTLCAGNYSAALREWQAERAATQSARSALQREGKRLAQRADQQRRRAAGAERERNAGRRMKGPHDHDATCILKSNQAEQAGRRLARDAAALESRVGRVERDLSRLHVGKELGGDVFADYTPWPKPLVLRVAFEALAAGGKPLLGPSLLEVGRAQKLCLQGPNGSGKTCLIRELERQNPRVFERSVYLPQAITPERQAALQRQLCELSGPARGRALNIVATLGSEPEAILASSAWSPGETRKVALALGLCASAPALILDEPTNHFDLPSIERLEKLLGAFPGCVVLVTHDDALAARVAERFLYIEQCELRERPTQAGLSQR